MKKSNTFIRIQSQLSKCALAAMIISVAACDHKTEPFDGPSLVDRFGPFEVTQPLSISTETVDFEAGETVVVSGEFNKNVDWILKIEGLESGAVKTIEGFDRFIGEGNAVWTGGTTTLPLFRAEPCRVTMRVPEEPEYGDTLMVTVLAPKVYEGILFADFETPPGQNIDVGNFEFEFTPLTGRRNDIPAGEREYFYFLEGTDNVVTNFFVGLIVIKSTITGNTYAPLPTTVPGQLYFNWFMWHDGTPHTIAVIQFIYDSNNSGAFEDGQDQTFQIAGDFPLNHVGWRHYHHTMADVGMTEAQLERLVGIRVLLISDNNAQPSPPLPVRFGVDYMTFTQGAPLQL